MKKLFIIIAVLILFPTTSNSDILNGRTYMVYTPPTYQRGLPLMIVLHGAFGDGATIANTTQMNQVALRESFIVAYPDGVNGFWNAGECCGNSDSDDVAFISRLIDVMHRKYRIDMGSIYLAGFSNGGMMAYRIACEIPERFAGITVVSGALVYEGDCSQANSVSILHIHGTADRFVPFYGGPGLLSGVYYLSAYESSTLTGTTLTSHDGGHSWPWWASEYIWDYKDYK